MKRKVWMTLGPVAVAFSLFLFILFGPSALFDGVSDEKVQSSATSMDKKIIQGIKLQKMALDTGNYVPFFGSSELSRVDSFHPSVVAKKYNRPYTPYLIGRAGTQSLSHYLDILALGDSLRDKKIVFILSPQWFQPGGVDDNHFGENYSPLHAYKFALMDVKSTEARKYTASRLLEFRVVQNDGILSEMLEDIRDAKNEYPKHKMTTELAAKTQLKILKRKDSIESKWSTKSRQARIDKALKGLPAELDFTQMDKAALQTGKRLSSNNPFHIKNKYFEKKIKPVLEEQKNKRVDSSYAESPEFNDLQLVMDAFKELNADVLFINPPVNGAWYDYIGFPQEGIDGYYQKSGDMIKEQGFDYLDMSPYQDTPYYLEDSIHLGWRGWVEVDRVIHQFMEQPLTTNYKPAKTNVYIETVINHNN